MVMKLILKPLFDAELPAGFEEILKAKLIGREIKAGQEIEVDLLGKPLRFKVIYAEPEVLKVSRGTRVELASGETLVVDLEFDEPIRHLISFENGFVLVFLRKVLILNQNGQKIYSDEFEEVNKVSTSKDTVVIVHGKRKVRLVKP